VSRYCRRTTVLKCSAAFGIYIMSDAAMRDHTPKTLPAIHLTASRCLLKWATSKSSMLLSSRPRKFNVRRILLSFFRTWKASSSGSVDSKYCEILARHEWSLHVSLHRFSAHYSTQSFLSSWEYFTTLDYEWRVIRGRLPYRWTIWVRALHFGFIRHALPLS
jgi:hypothetical protein